MLSGQRNCEASLRTHAAMLDDIYNEKTGTYRLSAQTHGVLFGHVLSLNVGLYNVRIRELGTALDPDRI